MQKWTYWVIAVAIGCGPGAPAEPEPEPSSGGEGQTTVTVEQAAEAAPEPEPEIAEPDGPARLTLSLRVSREEAQGTVRVLGSGDEVVAEGASGSTFEVPAGRYVMQAVVSEPTIVGHTERRSDPITLMPEEERSVTVEIPVSRIRLSVRRRGREVRNATVFLRAPGTEETVAEVSPSEDYLLVAAGRYDALVRFGSSQYELSGLVFPADSRRVMPINVQ